MKTVVLGATPKNDRFANRAVRSLVRYGHEVVPLGRQTGTIGDLEILDAKPELKEVHTVTLYLNPTNQKEWYEYIMKLNPKRIIFNPGTENPELIEMAREKGIDPVIGCTLVMLAGGSYDERN
ncbi:MAG: CoA-binding protein [Bacteroidota bacterium]|nr:CoA-binding protein [Bacteroidota bacterium]